MVKCFVNDALYNLQVYIAAILEETTKLHVVNDKQICQDQFIPMFSENCSN
jgi:hypothetical protein